MKKIVLIICLLSLSLYASFGNDNPQDQPDRKAEMAKIKALKVGYITDEVGLTPSESEKFWPLYNQYWDEKRQAGHKMRDLSKKVQSGVDIEGDLAIFLELRQLDVDNMNKWSEKFKTVLTPQKVLKVFMAEENFKRFLLNQNRK